MRHLLHVLAASITSLADQVPFAIVHGPKAAFNITAPEGWIIDNSAGAENGLPCVLFLKGQTWETADPLMYTKIAGTSIEDAEAFATTAIEEAKKGRGDFKVKRVEAGKTESGQPYFINEYAPNEEYPRTERVAYLQMAKAVAFIVYSADSTETFRKHQSALKQAIESFKALDVKPQDEQ